MQIPYGGILASVHLYAQLYRAVVIRKSFQNLRTVRCTVVTGVFVVVCGEDRNDTGRNACVTDYVMEQSICTYLAQRLYYMYIYIQCTFSDSRGVQINVQ